MSVEVRSPQRIDKPSPPAEFGRRLLAEGDSWFAIGSLNLPQGSNLLNELRCKTSTLIVNCAAPGDELVHMAERRGQDSYFPVGLGASPHARFWEAILLSAGGNDLIAALQVPPGAPLDRRLLKTPAEAGLDPAGEDFVSSPGWQRFADYLQENLKLVLTMRDAGFSASSPLLLHTYALPVPRPSGSLGSRDGWLYPRLRAYGVPAQLDIAVAQALFGRLRALLLSFDADSGSSRALPRVHVFDSAGLSEIQPAKPMARGPSGDWINEIHLSRQGCRKVGKVMGPWMEQLLHDRYGR